MKPSDLINGRQAGAGIHVKSSLDISEEARKRAGRNAIATKREQARTMTEENRRGLGPARTENIPREVLLETARNGARQAARVKRVGGNYTTIYGARTYEGTGEKPPALEGYCRERCGQRATVGEYCRWHARMFGEI